MMAALATEHTSFVHIYHHDDPQIFPNIFKTLRLTSISKFDEFFIYFLLVFFFGGGGGAGFLFVKQLKV